MLAPERVGVCVLVAANHVCLLLLFCALCSIAGAVMYVLKRRAKRAVVQATFRALVNHRCAVSPGCQSPNPASAQVNNILGYLYALVLISIYDSYVSEYLSTTPTRELCLF